MSRITTAGIWPDDLREDRLARHFSRTDPAGCQVAMVGLADDLGVRLNGGRIGAAEGPYAFRSALARYGNALPIAGALPRVFDAGDVMSGLTLAETHDRVTRVIRALLDLQLVPVGIGGGHDLTYAMVRGLAESTEAPLTGIYFDAHLDVREQEGSGMTFRRIVEECGVEALHVFGLDPFANAAGHMEWFVANGGQVGGFGFDGAWPEGDLFVSLDLDVLDQAYAPGVSAMNPAGWSPARAENWVRAAGRNPRVRLFDIMELAPRHDPEGRTARLAARLFLAFLQGVAERTEAPPPLPPRDGGRRQAGG
jgi:formiminoglutamase